MNVVSTMPPLFFVSLHKGAVRDACMISLWTGEPQQFATDAKGMFTSPRLNWTKLVLNMFRTASCHSSVQFSDVNGA